MAKCVGSCGFLRFLRFAFGNAVRRPWGLKAMTSAGNDRCAVVSCDNIMDLLF